MRNPKKPIQAVFFTLIISIFLTATVRSAVLPVDNIGVEVRTFLYDLIKDSAKEVLDRPNALRSTLAAHLKIFEWIASGRTVDELLAAANLEGDLSQKDISSGNLKTQFKMLASYLFSVSADQRPEIFNRIPDAELNRIADIINQSIENTNITKTKSIKLLTRRRTGISLGKDSGEAGKLIKDVIGKYFSFMPIEKKRKLIQELLLLPPDANTEMKLGVLLHNSGPVFQKILQLVGKQAESKLVENATATLLEKVKTFDSQIAREKIEDDLTKNVEFLKKSFPELASKIPGERVRIEDLFSKFSDEPIAAGTVSQVYRGTLKTGEEVAVKVRRPNIVKEIHEDLEILRKICEENQYGMEVFRQAEEALLSEADFLQEARYLELGEKAYSGKKEGIKVSGHIKSIPPSKDLLITRFVKGNTLVSGDYGASYIKGRALSDFLELWFEEAIFGSGFFHGDPHDGNIFYREPRYKLFSTPYESDFIDFGNSGILSHRQRRGYLMLAAAVADKNVPEIVVSLKLFCTFPSGDQEKKVESAIRDLDFENLSIPHRIQAVIEIAIKQGVQLPSEFYKFNRAKLFLEWKLYEINGALYEKFIQSGRKSGKKMDELNAEFKGFYPEDIYQKIIRKNVIKDLTRPWRPFRSDAPITPRMYFEFFKKRLVSCPSGPSHKAQPQRFLSSSSSETCSAPDPLADLNFPINHDGCHRSLAPEEQLRVLEAVSLINQDFFSGNISEEKRNEGLKKLIDTLSTKEKDPIRKKALKAIVVQGNLQNAAPHILELAIKVKAHSALSPDEVKIVSSLGISKDSVYQYLFEVAELILPYFEKLAKSEAVVVGDSVLVPPTEEGKVRVYSKSEYESILKKHLVLFETDLNQFLSSSKEASSYGSLMEGQFRSSGATALEIKREGIVTSLMKERNYIVRNLGAKHLNETLYQILKQAFQVDSQNISNGVTKLNGAMKAAISAPLIPLVIHMAPMAGGLISMKIAQNAGSIAVSSALLSLGLSVVDASIHAGIDSHFLQENWFCNFVENLSDEGSEALFAAPFLAALPSGIALVSSGVGKAIMLKYGVNLVRAKTHSWEVLNAVTALGFLGSLGGSAYDKVKGCYSLLHELKQEQQKGESLPNLPHLSVKTYRECLHAGIDLTFALKGAEKFAAEDFKLLSKLVGVESESLVRSQQFSIKALNYSLNERLIKSMETPIPPSSKGRISGINFKQAQEIYRKVTHNPVARLKNKVTYDPDDTIGFCFGRAVAAHIEALYYGIEKDKIRKVFAVGKFKYKNFDWIFHVTTIIQADGGGWWAIDPEMGMPVKLPDWYELVRKWDTEKAMKLYVTPANRVGPFNSITYSPEEFDHEGYNGFFQDLMENFRKRNKDRLRNS